MQNSFTKLYSNLSDNSLKSLMMKIFNGAFSEIMKENMLSKLSKESHFKLTGNDKKVKIEETFSSAIKFGEELCEAIGQKADKNSRIVHIIKTVNSQELLNCFCVFLIDYIEKNVDKDSSYVAVALTKDNAGVDDYIGIQKNINRIYGKEIVKIIPVFDKTTEKPKPEKSNNSYDIYSSSEANKEILCERCGKENDKESVFCRFCGYAFPVITETKEEQLFTPIHLSDSPSEQSKNEKICTRCQKINKAAAKYCSGCGTLLENGYQSANSISKAGNVKPAYSENLPVPTADKFSTGNYQTGRYNGSSSTANNFAVSPTLMQNGQHPYSRLGGFLSAVVIIWQYFLPISAAIKVIFELISAGAVLIAVAGVSGYYGYDLSDVFSDLDYLFDGIFEYDVVKASVALVVLCIVYYLYSSFALIPVAKQIKNKNPKFLRNLQKVLVKRVVFFIIPIIGIMIWLFICSTDDYYLSYYLDSAELIFDYIIILLDLFAGIAFMIAVNIYAVTSVRAKIYMGSDQYLKHRLF